VRAASALKRLALSAVGALLGTSALGGESLVQPAPPTQSGNVQVNSGFAHRLDAARELAASFHLGAGPLREQSAFYQTAFSQTFSQSGFGQVNTA
jgi:hypothetical protein